MVRRRKIKVAEADYAEVKCALQRNGSGSVSCVISSFRLSCL